MPLTLSSARLNLRCQISRAGRRILPALHLMLWTLIYRFESAFACRTRRGLFTFPPTACSTLAFTRWRRRAKVARGTAELPWNTV